MAVTQEKSTGNLRQETMATKESEPVATKIDRNAPAGSKNSLGAESVRDGRPGTDDSVVEAMDELGPDVQAPLATDTTDR
jgi:hypothetical protein